VSVTGGSAAHVRGTAASRRTGSHQTGSYWMVNQDLLETLGTYLAISLHVSLIISKKTGVCIFPAQSYERYGDPWPDLYKQTFGSPRKEAIWATLQVCQGWGRSLNYKQPIDRANFSIHYSSVCSFSSPHRSGKASECSALQHILIVHGTNRVHFRLA
jgi:hypothetical protein